MYRHGIICSEKTHFYFKGGDSSQIFKHIFENEFYCVVDSDTLS